MTTMPNPTRVTYIDIAKGILIVLVVFGHAWRALFNNGLLLDARCYQRVDGWIYSFHMPAFFFLAGILALQSAARPLGQFVLAKLQTVAYPYVLWSIIQTALQVAMAGSVTHVVTLRDLLRIPYDPIMQYWFLYALFFVFVLFALLLRLTRSRLFFLGVGVLLWVLLQQGHLSSLPVLVYLGREFIFFSAGLLCSTFLPRQDSRPSPRGWLVMAMLLAGVASLFVPALAQAPSPVSAWLAPVVAIPGIALVLALARLLAVTPNAMNRLFASLGTRSLEIFCAHTIFAAGFRIVYTRAADGRALSVHLAGAVIAGVVGPLILVHGAERVRFRYLFTWPRQQALGQGVGACGEQSSFCEGRIGGKQP